MRHVLVLLCLLLAAPGLAQAPALDCGKEANRAQCAALSLAKRLSTYAVPAIDKLPAAKGQVVRAFILNGNGQDVVLVSVTRLAGEEPRVETRFPTSPVAGQTERLSAVLPLAMWDRLVAEGQYFDRALAPLPEMKGGSVTICVHAWSVIVESVDAEGKVRRATQHGCEDGLALPYAFRLAQAAIGADPVCALLDATDRRAYATGLVDCRLFAGDRTAAAQAFKVMHSEWFLGPRGADFARSIEHFFAEDVVLNWPGEAPVHGWQQAAKTWADHGEDGHFEPDLVFGESADRVRMEGHIVLTPGEHEWPPREARATMAWTRENGFDFRLKSVVSEAPPSPPPDGH